MFYSQLELFTNEFVLLHLQNMNHQTCCKSYMEMFISCYLSFEYSKNTTCPFWVRITSIPSLHISAHDKVFVCIRYSQHQCTSKKFIHHLEAFSTPQLPLKLPSHLLNWVSNKCNLGESLNEYHVIPYKTHACSYTRHIYWSGPSCNGLNIL